MDNTVNAPGALMPGTHICCIYETVDENREAASAFISRGLELGEKVIYIGDVRSAGKLLKFLKKRNPKICSCMSKGRLLVLASRASYLLGGVFDTDSMISMLGKATDAALSEGYPALRVTGETDWALSGAPGAEALQ